MSYSASNLPELETYGNRKVVISSRCEILLYSPEQMRIRCERMTISIEGDKLELETLDTEELSIGGIIGTISFETE